MDLPRTTPDDFGGGIAQGLSAVAKGVKSFADLLEVGRKQQQVVDFDKGKSEYKLGMDEFDRTLPKEDNTALWEPQRVRHEERLRAQIMKRTPDPETRRLLESEFQELSTLGIIAVRHDAAQMANQQRRGYADQAFVELSQQAAEAQDPAQRQELMDRYRGIIMGLSTGAEPAINPVIRTQILEKFSKEVEVKTAGHLLETDPESLKSILTPENFPHLSSGERYSLDQRANEVIRERTKKIKEAEEAQTELVNREMLLAITAPKASLISILEDVRKRVALPPTDPRNLDAKDGEHWINKIWLMIAAQDKASKTKEVDPYKTSDGPTLAWAIDKVVNHPDTMEASDLTGLAGHGLSNVHALQLSKQLIANQKAPPSEKLPLQMAQKTFEALRRGLTFIPADSEGNRTATVANITRNDTIAFGIWDEVVRRSSGEDGAKKEKPIDVLNELMVPYREERVKTWGDTWRGLQLFAQDPFGRFSGLAPTKEETDQAKQRLIRGGFEETPKNIAEAVKAARANAKKKIDQPNAQTKKETSAVQGTILNGIELIPPGELDKPKAGFDTITTAAGPIRILKTIRGKERQKVVDEYVRLMRKGAEKPVY